MDMARYMPFSQGSSISAISNQLAVTSIAQTSRSTSWPSTITSTSSPPTSLPVSSGLAGIYVYTYSRTSVARTLMARLQWLVRTRVLESPGKNPRAVDLG